MRIGFVSDVHWAADASVVGGWHNEHDFAGVPERLVAALAWFSERGVDLIAVGGDLAHAGDRASVEAVLELCERAEAPVLVVAGNHDVSPHPGTLREAHERVRAGNVDLLNGEGLVRGGIRVEGVNVGRTDGWFGAHVEAAPDPISWGEDPVLLLSHFPLLSRAQLLSEHAFPYPGDLIGRPAVESSLVARNAPTIVLSGHIHARDSTARGPVLQFSNGALVEAPYECALIEVAVDEDGVLWAWRESGRMRATNVAREPIFAPEVESWSYDGSQWRLASHESTAVDAPHATSHR